MSLTEKGILYRLICLSREGGFVQCPKTLTPDKRNICIRLSTDKELLLISTAEFIPALLLPECLWHFF